MLTLCCLHWRHAQQDTCKRTKSVCKRQDNACASARQNHSHTHKKALIMNHLKQNLPLLAVVAITSLMLLPFLGLTDFNTKGEPREAVVALSMLSITDENCRRALEQLPKLEGCQVHSTVLLSEVDRKTFKRLRIDLTCDPDRTV